MRMLVPQTTGAHPHGVLPGRAMATGIVGNSHLQKGVLVDVDVSGCLSAFIVLHSIPGSLLGKILVSGVGGGRQPQSQPCLDAVGMIRDMQLRSSMPHTRAVTDVGAGGRVQVQTQEV